MVRWILLGLFVFLAIVWIWDWWDRRRDKWEEYKR